MNFKGSRIFMLIILGSLLIVGLLLLYLNENRQKRKLQTDIDLLKPMIESVENIQDILYYCETQPKLNYFYLSPNIGDFLQGSWEEHIKNPDMIFDIVHPNDYEVLMKKKLGTYDFSKPIVVRFKDNRGQYVWYEEKATPVYKDGKFTAVIGVFRNINDKVVLQQKLEYNSTHDSLTDLHNRAFFQLKLDEFNELDVPIAVIIADLDNLKQVNDQYGHHMGDQLICEAAKCLKGVADENMTVARIGGDEFAIIIPTENLLQVEQYIKMAQEKMQENVRNPLFSPIQVSIGYKHSNSSYGVMERVLNEADDNMYQNKKKKKLDASYLNSEV